MGESGAEATRRRWKPIALTVAALMLGGGAAWLFWQARLSFPYEVTEQPVVPGGRVEIRAPGEVCGPLLVSIRTPSVLWQWDQTHAGNVVDDVFTRDERAWWSLSSSTYDTPVPCLSGGTTTFTLPADVTATVVAVCDVERRCAKVHVDQSSRP
jgi:hypothetical protein